ncbi:MAG: hypothetical protein WCC57_09620, partial [Paracoccaceae bacterium]
MAGWKAMGAGAQVSVVAVGAVVAAGLGWLVLAPAPDAPVAEPSAVVAAPTPAPVVESAEIAAPVAPGFDTVRVEPDGSALVAGRAAAGAAVSILVDGAEVATATADNGGKFAALFSLPASEAPRMLTLRATVADGAQVASTQSVALAATVAPVAQVAVIAAAVPETTAVPEATGVAEATAVPEVTAVPEAGGVAAEVTAAAVPEPVEPAAPAALLLSEAGAQVLQSDGAALEGVTIDAITYTAAGAVQLGGRGLGGSVLRLYLDNVELHSLMVPKNGGWVTTLPQVTPGIYTLRVDQLDDAGKVTSRFETPFKRETLEALAAATAPVAVAPVPVEPVPEPAPEAVAVAEPAPVAPVVAKAVAPVAVAPAPVEAAPVETAPVEPVPEQPVAVAPAPAEGAVAVEPVAAPAPAPAPVPASAPLTVTVQPGFTLWQIAQENFGEGVMYV